MIRRRVHGPDNGLQKSLKWVFSGMIVTATELANEGKSILDKVVQGGEIVEVQSHGITVAVIHPKVGATRSELLRLLHGRGFSQRDSRQLKATIDTVSEVVGYAGCD